jgi:hypothetical protein
MAMKVYCIDLTPYIPALKETYGPYFERDLALLVRGITYLNIIDRFYNQPYSNGKHDQVLIDVLDTLTPLYPGTETTLIRAAHYAAKGIELCAEMLSPVYSRVFPACMDIDVNGYYEKVHVDNNTAIIVFGGSYEVVKHG